MAIINQRKERTQKAERFERFSQTDICVAETQMKRDNTFREKRQNKKISLAFSLSLSPEFCLVRCCVWEKIRILFKINLFLLQEERFHDERRREKGKFRSYCIYIIASSSNRFPRFRRSVVRVRVRVRERARLDLPFFAAA